MMRTSVYKTLDEMNRLYALADKYNDRAYDLYQNGDIQKSNRCTRKAEGILKKLEGYERCMKMLGFDIWKDSTQYHIPLDNIKNMC